MYAVIMAGGKGTRFWPLSRKKRPKQLLSILSEKSMLHLTVERLSPIIPPDKILIVTTKSISESVKEELPFIPPQNIIAEPVGRNTAPCIALAAKIIERVSSPKEIMAVLPADHHISPKDAFVKDLRRAAQVASKGALVTFGIPPRRPETGYGYIETAEMAEEGVFQVASFHEKPSRQVAEEYIKKGNFFWNSGIFVWQVDTILTALKEYVFDLWSACKDLGNCYGTEKWEEECNRIYPSIDSISIDYAVMEKAKNVYMVRSSFSWNDVGSWQSLEDVWPMKENNISISDIFSIESEGCIAFSPGKLVALIGVKDLVIVDTQDALLICKKDQAQRVKELRERLKKGGYDHLL